MSTLIDLSRPHSTERVRGFQPPWRTIFVYVCPSPARHVVKVRAGSFRGSRPEPSRGAITCPQCEFEARYPQAQSS